MSAYEMAKKYYPHLWEASRLVALVKAGKLSAEEFKELTGQEVAAV